MKAIHDLIHTCRVHATTAWMVVAALWAMLCQLLMPSYPLDVTVGIIGFDVFAIVAWMNIGGYREISPSASG